MYQTKSKKILIYIFLFLIIGTFNNKDFNKIEIKKINQINVSGLSEEKNFEVLKSLNAYKLYNLFFLNKVKINQLISSYDYIENYSVFKRYPSSLIVQLTETNYLARVSQNGKNFYLGSNGKLIEAVSRNKKLPNIFGDLDLNEFFKLKKLLMSQIIIFMRLRVYFFSLRNVGI